MDRPEARTILSACNPAHPPRDEQVREALLLVETDSELADWWQEETRLDRQIREALAGVQPAPAAIESTLRALRGRSTGRRIVPLWRHPGLLAAAAAVVVGLFLGWRALQPGDGEPALAATPDAFRQQAATLVADGLAPLAYEDARVTELVSWVDARQASAVGPLPEVARGLEGLGCRIFAFGPHEVSVVCMADEDGDRWHLFTVERSAFDAGGVDEVVGIFRDLEFPQLAWADDSAYHVLVAENGAKLAGP